MSFLLDTDICSAHLKQSGALGSKLLQYTGRLYLSTVNLGELYVWALRAGAPPSRLRSLIDFLNDVVVLDVTEPIGRKFGELRAGLLDQGQPAPTLDLFIAATALVHDLTLVTHNGPDFRNVSGLRIDDWLTA